MSTTHPVQILKSVGKIDVTVFSPGLKLDSVANALIMLEAYFIVGVVDQVGTHSSPCFKGIERTPFTSRGNKKAACLRRTATPLFFRT